MTTKTDELDRLEAFLREVPDPRAERGRRHALVDILFIALAAMLGGADDAEAIALFGELHEDWFRKRLPLPHGIPSQDTFLRIFGALDPEAFQDVFRKWVNEELRAPEADGHVAFDGKTLRRSFDSASGGKSIHMVSAWLAGQNLVLGQVAVEEKSNEIVAIPALLKLLDVRGHTVTIDAMGCQRAIADAIVDAGGNYILAVKDNQPTLNKNISGCMADIARPTRATDDPAPKFETATEDDAGHGRVERRSCVLTRDLTWIENAEAWARLAAIAQITSTRTNKRTGAETTETRRYILSSSTITADQVLATIRDHWQIENRLHWVLDVTMREDLCRTRARNAAKNLAVIRHAGLNLLRTAVIPSKKKMSLAMRRRCSGWDLTYLEKVLAVAKPA